MIKPNTMEGTPAMHMVICVLAVEMLASDSMVIPVIATCLSLYYV